MTDVLVRDDLQPTPAPARRAAPDRAVTTGAALAAVSAAAGVIHLVMVPSHFTAWRPEGVAFAVAGWAQLALAAVFLRRVSRAALLAGVWLDAALVLAWVVSRTSGLPLGPDAGVAEPVGRVDVTCVAAEVAVVLLCALALARVGGDALRRIGAVAGVAAVVAATVAITSPGARDHAHGNAHAVAGTDDALGLGMLHNGHHDEITVQPLSPATQAALDAEIAVTREVAARYPTLDSALAAGYRRAGPYSPGLGLHVTRPSANALNADGRVDRDDLLEPMSIIYDGTAPSSHVAGFMYYSASAATPAGFAGGNDHWHYHTNVCIKLGPDGSTEAPLGADRSTTKADCDRFGGFLLAKTQWMVHVWSVPGYEVADAEGGVFGEVNPDLRCADGTYYQMPPSEWPSHPTNVCRAELS